MIPCSWKETFGLECLTCGAQSSFGDLIHGDFMHSLSHFPALIPLLVVVLIVPLHLFFKWKRGAKLIVFFFSLSAFLILGNYIIKLINGSVFL